MQKIEYFSGLAAQYDAFILDLWGVIHDGVKPYPGAVDCLKALHESGSPVVLLSNAPRPAKQVEEKMEAMGIPRSWYKDIITSGEATTIFLKEAQANGWGKHYYFCGLPDDEAMMAGTGFERVDDIAKADWVLCAGYDYFGQPPEEMDAVIKAAAARKLPALCTNPDIEVVRQSGERILCAGHLAQRYEALGGAVTYIGKPHEYVYELAMRHFPHMEKSKILAVGDGPHTDIQGANKAGIPCVLVTGGIMREVAKDEVALSEALKAQHAAPDYIMPAFNWQAPELKQSVNER